MNFDETMRSVETGTTLELATISYAESVAASVPVGAVGVPDPSEDELSAARTALRKRDWLDDQGKPAGPLLTFAMLGGRPACRTWFWESSRGTALVLLAQGRNVSGLAMPDQDHPGVIALSMQPVETLVRHVAEDAWQSSHTSLAAVDMDGQMLPVELDRSGTKAKVTAPKSPDQPPAARGMRNKVPMKRSTVDRAGFAQLVATAFDNPLWGLDDEYRGLAWSLT